jgi:hypothetical protein
MQITVEESKEADTTTKEATHRISRGIHDKVDKSLLCQSCIWLIKIILNSPVHTGLCTEHIFDLSIDNGSKNAKKNFNLVQYNYFFFVFTNKRAFNLVQYSYFFFVFCRDIP